MDTSILAYHRRGGKMFMESTIEELLLEQRKRYEKVLLSIAGQSAFSAWCEDGALSIVPYEEYEINYINDILKEQGLPPIENN